MREPAFWWRSPSWMSRLLSPLGLVYGAVSGWRMQQPGHRAELPVICVGNYSLGGAGKTPAAIALVKLLRRTRRDAGGAEPRLRRQAGGAAAGGSGRAYGCRRRRRAAAAGTRCAGHRLRMIAWRERQRRAQRAPPSSSWTTAFRIRRCTKTFAWSSSMAGAASAMARCSPSGPMRAPLATQIGRTDVLLISGDGNAAADVSARVAGKGGLVLRARIAADPQTVAALGGQRVLAFAGIGDPQRFFATLARKRDRCRDDARLPRPSPVHARRDQRADRGSARPQADAGDDGEGSRCACPASTRSMRR